ncbi:hypothetical protein EX30DRAFT_365426 [Ascodesmis nigricans]|uniref:F-box domain-containing protein n=1 Tax=Ascodesmis nigricans TaxID=341454 RepID=A0A4S2MQ58_9PEZI|nr:hypothetical protein EX30DRAFT_365426 [Ascodesmis nigricans]
MSSRYRWSGVGRVIGRYKPISVLQQKRREWASSPDASQQSQDANQQRRKRLGLDDHESRPSHTLSSLERLPTELLHRIFCDAGCAALASASISLAHVFKSRHLQLRYLYLHPDELSSLVVMRFFTPAFLEEYERRHGQIDASDLSIPSALSAHPWTSSRLQLLRTLVLRGGSYEGELDHHRENLQDAIRAGQGQMVADTLLTDTTFKPNTAAVEVAISEVDDVEDCLTLCTLLVDGGAPVEGVNVWKAALARQGNELVQFLLKSAAPPVEVLGQLAGR